MSESLDVLIVSFGVTDVYLADAYEFMRFVMLDNVCGLRQPGAD
jgi:hypothetical protein